MKGGTADPINIQPTTEPSLKKEPIHSAFQGESNENVWTVAEVRSVNDNFKVFAFTHPELRIRTHLPGVRWFGRNILITP